MVDLSDEDKKAIVSFVSNELAKTDLTDIPIKTMHNLVERALDTYNSDVAKSYRDYRNYKEDFIHIMDEVYVASQAIRYIGDKENANTDSALVATKRSLIYKELNKRLYRNFFMTRDEVEACRDGYIYIHDQSDRLDTMNCFSRDTKFVTVDGVRSFNEFNDGDTVKVISHTGAVRNAVVHSYGIQNLQEVTFANDVDVITVLVTENHRWILHDGSETTSLEVGDILVDSPLEHDSDTVPWTVIDINSTYRVEEVWCLEVEVDHSFLLEWGIPTGNCCLFDIEKVMTGGFEMGNIWYNEPKTLDTAFDVIGDIILSTASQQYGGFTVPEIDKILSPYAAKSYKKYLAEYDKILADAGIFAINSDQRKAYAMLKVQRDMEQGFQGIEMKLNTVGSSRGDYPFITMTFGLSTDVFGKMVSKTFLTVHMNGQGKAGNKKPVLFPKLVYLYDEELNKPGGVNEDVFEVAIKCSSKTMYPDWLSLTGDGYVPEMYKKYGRVISPMGCVLGTHKVKYRYNENSYNESFEQMWNRLSADNEHVGQASHSDINRVIYLKGVDVSVYDTKLGDFTKVNAIIRNYSANWCKVEIQNAEPLFVTTDHPFETENRGVVHADALTQYDTIFLNKEVYGTDSGNVVSVTPVKMLANSYDLTTDSEHFEVAGIYSHNCRAFLSPWYERGGMFPADENDKPVFVGRFNIGKLCAAHIGNNVLKSA